MAISAESIAHIRLTVGDIGRSRAFYDKVFGWPVALEVPEGADAETRERLGFLHGGVIYRLAQGLIGLRPAGSDLFDENRVGLDHLAFSMGSLGELEAAAAHLDACGVTHEEIKDIGFSYILEFRDPDNIALELTAPK
ncbi:VOC family protein [Nocardia tengchongensis]|uniref:VOC family protein n=1 Tax=Nocardia tengchongensis TaxID=2055889 RepID=A0ABX8CWU6_9NOCA|nr:VOC family protein [Nocardia tengchongensis]QVI24365.1 VOC family protein [Nocardia tengchongensis]